MLDPPVPLLVRPLLETVNFTTIALLPDSIREQYGFSALPPIAMRKALVAGGADYLKRGRDPAAADSAAARAKRASGVASVARSIERRR